jgi:hypothetical protein
MEPVQTVDAEVYASHRQFYVVDPEAEFRTDLVWDGAGLERHLGVSAGIVAVGTVGYCMLPVRIELWSAEPPADLDDWDHVVEASLEVSSGRVSLEGVEGPADSEPVEVAAGVYRLRSSASGLDGAGEMEGGDGYRVQLWPAAFAEPEVLCWWPPWDPEGATVRPTEGGGRVLLGAESHDAQMRMRLLASCGGAHLFEDSEGTLWEHSNLPDAAGTPQLEELPEEEAERRYGPRARWGLPPLTTPSMRQMLKNIVQTVRYSRGWRP